MAAWSDGYFTDVQYTANYYPELAPGFLAFACLRELVRPPVLGPGSSYLELGCGQGFGLNLLAAANPGMAFRGVDFHPGQIANASRLARAAGLSNVTFEDLSFEQMLALPEGRLPKFDIVSLHGIYSWVGPENRAVIVRILDRVVKPGGLVYVSYNCLPGWAPLAPLQRFVRDHVARTAGDPQARVMDALRAAMQLLEGGALYFERVPSLKQRITEALQQKPAYLVHEYLNADSHPFFHADVAQDLDRARLSFAASANFAEDLVHLAAPAALRPMIEAAQDRTWKEALLDYAANRPFRRDIFVRGRNILTRRERDALLEETRFTLLKPSDEVTFEFQVPVGQLKGDPGVYGPIVAALAEGPRSYGELSRLPQLSGARDGVLLQAINLLVGSRQIHPADDAEAEAALAFNRAVLARTDFDEFPVHLACPKAGTGVRLEFEELLAAGAVVAGEDDVARTAQRGWEIMARTGRRLLKDGEVLRDQAANEAELSERLRKFSRSKLPLLRSLGVV